MERQLDPRLFRLPGWHLLGSYPESWGDEGVGSWLLHHDGEAMLLELPEELDLDSIRAALRIHQCELVYITASHEHEDHFDEKSVEAVCKAFPQAELIDPSSIRDDRQLCLGDEPLWLLPCPKHSLSDVVTVFRGVAMTGDIELSMLESVNKEVPHYLKEDSFAWMAGFPQRTGYRVHTAISAHLNSYREGLDRPNAWSSLFPSETSLANSMSAVADERINQYRDYFTKRK